MTRLPAPTDDDEVSSLMILSNMAVPRDWTKVTNYCKRLGIIDASFEPNTTNGFLSWQVDAQDDVDPDAKQKEIALYQANEAHKLLASATPRALPSFGCKYAKASAVQASA